MGNDFSTKNCHFVYLSKGDTLSLVRLSPVKVSSLVMIKDLFRKESSFHLPMLSLVGYQKELYLEVFFIFKQNI